MHCKNPLLRDPTRLRGMNIPETWDPTNITTPKIRTQQGYSDLSSWHIDPSEAIHILASERVR